MKGRGVRVAGEDVDMLRVYCKNLDNNKVLLEHYPMSWFPQSPSLSQSSPARVQQPYDICPINKKNINS